MSDMETFTLVPRGPFTLASSIRFLEGFTPAGYSGPLDAALDLAFPSPQRLASLEAFPGLIGRKPEWLRSVAPYRTWVTLLLRTQQEIPAAGELRWGQHEVVPRVPSAVRSCCDQNQDGRDWTKRHRDPAPTAQQTWARPAGEHLTG